MSTDGSPSHPKYIKNQFEVRLRSNWKPRFRTLTLGDFISKRPSLKIFLYCLSIHNTRKQRKSPHVNPNWEFHLPDSPLSPHAVIHPSITYPLDDNNASWIALAKQKKKTYPDRGQIIPLAGAGNSGNWSYLFFLGEMIISNDKYFMTEINNSYYSVQMKLIIRRFQKSDLGGYKCISKNSIGDAEGTIRLYGEYIF